MDRNGTKRRHSVFAYLHIFLHSHASLRLLFGFPLKVLLEIFKGTINKINVIIGEIFIFYFLFYRPDITNGFA